MQKTLDLGKDKIGSLLFRFSFPCVVSQLISSLYNIVDQIFIGNSSLEYYGNGATGVVFPIIIVANAFAWGFGDGVASFLSICQGKKDSSNASKAVGTGSILTIFAGLLIMLFSFLFNEPILRFCGASDNTIGYAKTYLFIVGSFFPIYMLIAYLNGVIRVDGSPIFAMVTTGIGAIINIILDPIFIYVLDWGMEGAAWATVIGQLISIAATLIYFFKTKTFKLTIKDFIPEIPLFKEPCLLGISSFITQISVAIINLVGNAVLVRYGNLSIYGQDIPISATSIESKVATLVLNIVVGIVLGAQPIIGYNKGAGNIDRIRKTYRLILYWCLGIGIVCTLFFELYPEGIIMIFGGSNEELYMEYAKLVFRLFLSTTVFTCFIKMSSIFFQSCGESLKAIVSSLVRDILFFIPSVILLPIVAENVETGSGVVAVLYAPMIADSLALIIVIFFTIKLFKELRRYEKTNKNENETVIK